MGVVTRRANHVTKCAVGEVALRRCNVTLDGARATAAGEVRDAARSVAPELGSYGELIEDDGLVLHHGAW
jgi:hypothetical protein